MNRAIVIWTSNGILSSSARIFSSSNRIIRTDDGIRWTKALQIMPFTSLEIPGTELFISLDVPREPVDGLSRPSPAQRMRAPELLLRPVVLKIPADVQNMTSSVLALHDDELLRIADLPEITSSLPVCIADHLKVASCLLVRFADELKIPSSFHLCIAQFHAIPSPFTVCNADFLRIPADVLACSADLLKIPSPFPGCNADLRNDCAWS